MAVFLSSLIVFFVLLGIPAANYMTIKKIRDSQSAELKERTYYIIITGYWIITIIIFLLKPPMELFMNPYSFQINDVIHTISFVMMGYMIFTVALPLLLLPFIKRLREKMREQYDARLYPVTSKQQIIFIFVAVTVGICEEIMFRGFLNHYLVEQLGLTTWGSFLLVAFIFGLGHFMQGISGIVTLGLFGFIMGYLYIVTGSLLLPIIIHILYDMKSVYIASILRLQMKKDEQI